MKKKALVFTFLTVFLADFFAWSENFGVKKEMTEKKSDGQKILVTYFSHRGSTKIIGDWIAKDLDADIFEIKAEKQYPVTYSETLPVAKTEQEENARPKILDHIENLADYDVVFVGYPLWFGKMPMILYSFFDEYDFSGKKIVPFVTYGGSPFARGWNAIPELEPNAKIIGKLAIRNNMVKNSEKKVERFVKSLKLNYGKKSASEKSAFFQPGLNEKTQPVVIGMPNPVQESTAEEILKKIGVSFAVPDGAEKVHYSVISDSLAQMDFLWNRTECTARAEPSGETSLKDISGFYYNWKNSADVKVGYNNAKANWTKDENGNSVGICIWWDTAPGIMYSVSMRKNADAKNLEKLANAVYVQMQGNQ